MFVNDEKPIPYFNLFFSLVLGGKRHKMGVKKLIYPSFLTKVGYRLVAEGITGG